uniref:NADH-ubiquinone oxidoreductase chain 2 n=1 Tax=Propsilocerus akamusi TaxID=903466 RepID=A0A8K1K675_9DIPT|nr:NADH dehydrogenase subunit 2 [Propsilocerus akamusi]UDD74628.1 NADH dehydrogenase subunit 2 [Propsilocerus akamusi]
MVKNSYKSLFLISLISGSLLTISSSSWFGAWMGLEINLLSFIPLMIGNNNLFSAEASLKYFLTQALASSILLFSIIMFFMLNNWMSNNFLIFSSLLISSTLFLKSGAAPFHFWFPSVMEGLTWNNCMILMTWQKIAPLMLISYCMNSTFLFFIIFCSIIFGSLTGLNQTSMRKLMAFSSINHLGWMIAGMLYSENLWLTYFSFYSFLSITIIFLLNNFKIFNLMQLFSFFKFNVMEKFLIFIPFLSLGGLPPFLGFFPKWLIIQSLLEMELVFILLMMVIFTLITLFFYLRICYSAFMLNHNEINWNFKKNFYSKNFFYCLMFNFFSVSGLFLITLFFYTI